MLDTDCNKRKSDDKEGIECGDFCFNKAHLAIRQGLGRNNDELQRELC